MQPFIILDFEEEKNRLRKAIQKIEKDMNASNKKLSNPAFLKKAPAEIVEEVRERAVSSDNFFEQPVRRLFRRPERAHIPRPAFNPQLVRPAARRGRGPRAP